MENLIEYLKDKIYYVIGATVIIIILIIALNSCNGMSSLTYEDIERNMVNAAKKYYSNRKDALPTDNSSSVKVTVGTLIDGELLKEIKDPNKSDQTCDGYVQVKKVDDEYAYIPFLTCKGNYEPKYLTDIVKNSKLDEYGNGVYEIDGDYVYRGEEVKNYISIGNQTWRIVKVDEQGDIKLIFAGSESLQLFSVWDNKYNSITNEKSGINTDYLHSTIRKYLDKFYEEKLSDDFKLKIVEKNICIGPQSLKAKDDQDKECSITRKEKIGLISTSDYTKASLDNECIRFDSPSCINRNYLSSSSISTWLLTPVSDNNYEVYSLYGKVKKDYANSENEVLPVVYLSKDTIVIDGDGTIKNMYKIK